MALAQGAPNERGGVLMVDGGGWPEKKGGIDYKEKSKEN